MAKARTVRHQPRRNSLGRNLLSAAMQPLAVQPWAWRIEAGPMFLVFACTLALYGYTAPREVALEDDGLFLMILHYFGVGHPPGYPLYTLLGSPFYHLLPETLTPAYRGHLFSAFMGAIACVAIYAIMAMLVRSRLCALAAGLAYAVSEAFWSQSIIAEVYTLNAAIFFIVLAMCLRYAAHIGPATRRNMILYMAIAFMYGLGLSNHWPLLGLGSVGLLMVVLSQMGTIIRRVPLGLLCLALGLLPYLWMYLRSNTDVPINFLGPIKLDSMWFYISRGSYASVDYQTGVGWEEKLVFSQYFLVQLTRQFTLLGLVLAGLGWVVMLRSKRHGWLAVSLSVSWVMAGPLLVYLLDFQTEFVWFSVFRVYHLMCYGITAIWFGYGLAWLGKQVARYWPQRKGALAIQATTAVLVITLSLVSNWQQNNRRDYTWARDFAMYQLSNVAEGAKLFTNSDTELPVGYLHMVEGVRPDIEIFNDRSLVFALRLYPPVATPTSKARIIANYVNQTAPAPIYYIPHQSKLFQQNGVGSEYTGFWRRLKRNSSQESFDLAENLQPWVEANMKIANTTKDRMTRFLAANTIAHLIDNVKQAIRQGHDLDPKWQETITRAYAENDLVHFLHLGEDTFGNKLDLQRAQEELIWIDEVLAATQEIHVFDNSNWSDLLFLKSMIYANFPNLVSGQVEEEYERLLLRALQIDFKQRQFQALVDYYRSVNRQSDALALLNEHYPAGSSLPAEYQDVHELLTNEIKLGNLLRPVVKFAWDS